MDRWMDRQMDGQTDKRTMVSRQIYSRQTNTKMERKEGREIYNGIIQRRYTREEKTGILGIKM